MTELTSSALFSAPHVLTDEEVNTVFSAVIEHKTNVESKRNIYNRFSLLPTLNTDFTRLAYYEINDKPNMTAHFLTSHSSFNIYFCKFDDNVYKVVTGKVPSEKKVEDNLPQNVYYVSKVSPLMSW